MAKETKFTQHTAKWSKCQGCELHAFRKNVVIFRGNVPCDVLLIGEAPGPSEDVLGAPFLGPAGKMLDGILEKAGFVHSKLKWGFTNLVGCIPKDDVSAKFAEPPITAIKACNLRLRELVEMCKPKIVIGVGKLAAQHTTDLITSDYHFEIIHPAALLRMDDVRKSGALENCLIVLEDILQDHLDIDIDLEE